MNITSAFLTIKTVLPSIALKHGAIVTMAPAAGRIATPASPACGGANAGLLLRTRRVALQVFANGVRIKRDRAGAVLNDRISQAREQVRKDLARAHPLGRIGLPGDIAQSVVFLLSDAASWVTGATVEGN